MTDDAFLSAFEAATLTKADWTHDAHVRMAWLYLNRLPFTDALSTARAGIQRLNQAFAPADRCAPAKLTGYHDTITVAFVRIIAGRLVAGETYDAFRERNRDLFDRSLSAIRTHYTKKLLFSAKARKAFIEPDRKPLPAVGQWGVEPQTGHKPAPRRRKAATAAAATSA